MEGDFDFSAKLEKLARSSMRFSYKVKPEIDYEQEYRDIYSAFGVPASDIEDFIDNWELSKIKAQRFYKRNPKCLLIHDILNELHADLIGSDTRNPDLISYDITVVIFVVLLATICNCNDDAEIAEFWFFNNMELQHLIPGMPSPKHMISDETVRTIRKLVSEDVMHAIFKKYFDRVKFHVADMVMNKQYDSQNYRKTLGGDGQELRATFREGCFSRKRKGGHVVSIYDCDEQRAVGYKTVHKKNQEVQAFIDILDKIEVDRNIIFYADALNLRDVLINYLNKKYIDWLFPVKNNAGNKELRKSIAKAFGEIKDPDKVFTRHTIEKISGRIEETTYSMMGAENLPEEIRNKYGKLCTIIKVEKTTTTYNARNTNPSEQPKGTTRVHYYISSLEGVFENFRQLVHSISVRWYFEVQHNTLDCFFLQDSQALCNEDNIKATVGKNKIAYNLVAYARQRLSVDGYRHTRFRTESSAKRKPLSFKQTRQALACDIYLAFRIMIDFLVDEYNDADIVKSEEV